ncbi:MAG: MucBP domain-containing protein [Clostridium sp.]|nr:MucBP domain-containing protein [Clostridium sp.]
MILLEVFALIFSINNKENESLGSGNEEYNAGGTINGDKGYISSAQIIQTKTGTGPWDANDEPGNDSSEDNNIVRSFDQVTWTIDLTMTLKSGIAESNLTGGIIKVEATIPQNCANVVSWDLDSMGWLEGSGKVSSDGLVLTGQYVMSTTDNTIPGKQTLVLVLKVEGAQNQTKIKPEFKFWLEGNEDEEKYTINDVQDVTVSAAPKYNVELKRNDSLAKEITLNENGESQNGRLYGYSLTYQLYNEGGVAKGLKGIEYPEGEINLDLNLKLEKVSTSNTNNIQDITETSTPILYNYKMNKYDNSSGFIPNRNMAVTYHAAHEWRAPAAFGGGDRQCYDSGTISMNQNKNTINTSLTDYKFNGEFPVRFVGADPGSTAINYADNIGCFSVVYFQVFVPFTEETSEGGYNYYLTVTDTNMKAYSSSGTKLSKQTIATDDSNRLQHVILNSGGYSTYHWLSSNFGNYSGSSGLYSHYSQGDAKAEIGQKFIYRFDITCGANNDSKDDIYDVNALMKFDGQVLKPTQIDGMTNRTTGKSTNSFFTSNMKFKMLYAAKKDGSNWESDSEMKSTIEDDLLFFKSEEDLKKQLGENAKCIGVLFESISGTATASSGFTLEVALEVTQQAQIGNVYQFVTSSKLYKKDKKLDRTTQTKENPTAQFPSPDVSINYNYIKTAYDKNGNIMSGTHNGGYTYGQSLLIVGGKLSVIHSVEDKTTAGSDKVNYDIGRNENTVTFGLKPQLQTSVTTGTPMSNITVTLEETLPVGLEYIPGSSSYNEPTIENLSNGGQKLTWIIYGCTVGQDIEKITYQAKIDEESANGTQYTASVLATADKIGTSLPSTRTDSNTIQITNLASHRLYKEVENTIIEKNGKIKYTVVYENKTEDPVPEFQLLDVLPYNGDNRETDFNGTYTLESINIQQKVNGAVQSTNNLKLYTTNSTTVRNMTAKDDGIGTDNIWAEKTIGSSLNESVTGIAVKGQIAGKTRLEIEITLQTQNNEAKDIYANTAMAQVYADSEQMQTGKVETRVVYREITGKVWDDSNRNGVIDSSEKYLEGRVVKLLNSTNSTEVTRTTTNAQGEYEFTDLAKGTYKVEVEVDNLHELTDKEVGSNREINSKFNQASKQTDEITKLNTISSPEIIEDNVNAGIRTIQFNINTKVEGVGGNISGEGQDFYESVDKGQDSKKDIIITPNAGYRVATITVNGEKITFTEEANHTVILNKFINMQEDKEVIVTFKDVRTSVLVHHYKENTTEKLSEDVLINGEIGDSYTTQVASDIPQNYEVVSAPSNASGNMVASQTVVTYYYRLKTPTITSQNMTKNGTEKIENLTDEITYDIVYKATLEDYIGEAEITIVDKLPYQIVVDSSDLAGGTFDATGKIITWTETIKDINSYESKNNEITINKTIKVVYTGINQGTTNIKNVVTGKIKTKTPEKEFDEVTANETTTTEFTVNIPVSKIWEDDSNKLGQRPTRVTFKLVGSDGSEYTKELAKPGTSGTTTTQDQSNPNKWNDIFTNLPKYDSNNQEIKYTLTEINGNLTYYDVTVDNTGKIVTNTNKYGKVTVHYYIMNTDGTTTTTRVPDVNGTEIPDVIIEGKEGEEYNTTWANNVNEKYELVAEKLPANATGKIEKYNEEKPQEVIYYYRLKQAKVIINYIEKDTNQVLSPEEQIDGHVDDSYNTNTEYRKETIQKDGRTYTLVEDSGNTEGIINLEGIEVTYYYLQNTKATVRYVARDPETHEIVKELEEPYTQEGLVGDKFVTNEKAFIGYKLVESPTNKTINMTKEEQTLIYYYEPVYTGLIENHIDDKTGRVLYTEEHQVQVGTEYNIPSKEFEGYDLVESKLPANAEGIMGEELVTVNYYYIKKAVLEVNYIDIYTNKPLTDKKVDNTKHEGDLYTTEQKEFENYDLVEVPSNASGTIAVETDEEGNITNNRTVVTYYYTQRAIVEEHHIDSLTGKDIEESKIHNGHVGDEYDIPSKEFLSYQLIEEDEEGNSMLPANNKGTMTAEKIVVNYYYNQPAKVIVHYIEKTTEKELEETNPETGEVESSQVTIEGFNQDEYTTEAKEFKYYTLIETELPTNAEGEMKVEIVEDEEGNKTVNNTIDVYYYYEAKPFNIGVEKEITGIAVNGETRTPTNGKLERVEIYRKDVEKTNIQIVYRIRVINSGEVEGAVTIEDKLPEGMNLVNNDGTWEEQDGILRKIIPEINPGETKEYTVVLNWNTAENNMGEKDNVINIVDTQNVPGFIDNNDKDNTSNANVIISVETGELPIGLILALVALVGLETVTLRYAVVLTKRQKKKVNKK